MNPVAERLTACFGQGGLTETVQAQIGVKHGKLLVRVRQVQTPTGEWADDPAWLDLMALILKVVERTDKATTFLGTSYWLRPTDGELIYGWIICFYGTDSHEDYLAPLEKAFGIIKEAAPTAAQVGRPQKGIKPEVLRSETSRPTRELKFATIHGVRRQTYNQATGKGVSVINPDLRQTARRLPFPGRRR